MRYRFDDYLLDTGLFLLLRAGDRVEIQPQVLKLLVYLIENRDRVNTRAELLEKFFGQRVVTDNALTVRIRDLRRAVGDTTRPFKVVETVPGIGYRFIASVETLSYLTSETGRANGHVELGGEGESFEPLLRSKPSIAILPFEVIGDADPTIAKGLVHDLITRIARTRTMLVIARGTAFQFSSGNLDVNALGRKLGVTYIVQGAIQVSGDKMRLSVAIASVETREEFWSEQYDCKIDNVLVLQDEIATMVVSALEMEVQRLEMQRSFLLPSSRLDAWSAYHRGLGHMYRFRTKGCDDAEKYFRRAIDLEPDVPRPYAGLSFVSYQRAYLNVDDERVKELHRAFEYAAQSILLDPKDPMGHWAMSRAHFLNGDLEAAMRSIQIATSLNPSYATAQYFQGWIAMQRGDRETCMERIDLARQLSPYDPLIYGMLGVSAMNLALSGDYEEAKNRMREALAHPEIHYQAKAMAAISYALVGEPDSARAMFGQVKRVNPDYSADDFFSVYAFQAQEDIQRITRAFEDLQR